MTLAPEGADGRLGVVGRIVESSGGELQFTSDLLEVEAEELLAGLAVHLVGAPLDPLLDGSGLELDELLDAAHVPAPVALLLASRHTTLVVEVLTSALPGEVTGLDQVGTRQGIDRVAASAEVEAELSDDVHHQPLLAVEGVTLTAGDDHVHSGHRVTPVGVDALSEQDEAELRVVAVAGLDLGDELIPKPVRELGLDVRAEVVVEGTHLGLLVCGRGHRHPHHGDLHILSYCLRFVNVIKHQKTRHHTWF